MQLFVEPDNGVFPILNAIHKARRTLDMHIFRLAYKDIEKALAAAVRRGVVVRTLIAHTSASGEKALRKLEQRLLQIGATVSRTADDLVRYHGKIMIVDGSWLLVLAFNLTRRDIDESRTLGVATRKHRLVQEAIRLFAADFDRKSYTGGAKDFLVSPVNARERLAAFLTGAKRQLLIYDEGVADKAMIHILQNRAKAGVDLRIIGKVEKGHDLTAEKYPGKRQHLRCIVRDGRAAFVGSQSLRTIELDGRREIGVIVKDPKVVRGISRMFESDWAETDAGKKQAKEAKEQAKEKEKEEREREKERARKADEGGEKGAPASAGA
jgi:phosphatidylserine/phosphatidylglycerophosphate/cardiolipin synthase-like enzyme